MTSTDVRLVLIDTATMENRPKSAHRYNVQEQQDVYRQEIVRIWKAQQASLSNPIEPNLTQEDEERQRGSRYRRGGSQLDDGSNAGTPVGQTPGSRGSSPADDMMSTTSGRAGGQNKVLRIKRLVRSSSFSLALVGSTDRKGVEDRLRASGRSKSSAIRPSSARICDNAN